MEFRSQNNFFHFSVHSFANKVALIDTQKQRILALNLRDLKYIHVKHTKSHLFFKELA